MTSARDPGLQPQRTSIAWTRTCTALIVVALIGIRFHDGALPAVLSLAGLVAAGMLMLASSRRGSQTERGLQAGRVEPAVGLAVALTALCLTLSAGAAVMMLALSR